LNVSLAYLILNGVYFQKPQKPLKEQLTKLWTLLVPCTMSYWKGRSGPPFARHDLLPSWRFSSTCTTYRPKYSKRQDYRRYFQNVCL
jgi:hypothetical protein